MNKLTAKNRDVLGKKVKKLRTAGDVPAVVFGPKRTSANLVVNDKEFSKIFKEAGHSMVVELATEGQAKPVQVLIKEVQQDPISRQFLHISLYEIDADKELHTEIPIRLIGESEALKKNIGFLATPVDTIEVRCLAANLPAYIEVDISGLKELGDSITVGSLKLPDGVNLGSSMQTTTALAYIAIPQKRLEVEETAAAATAAATPAEGAAAATPAKGAAAPAKAEAAK